ncbi:MAG: ribonuclease HII [Ruminococcaceae bacterium]|nr:ribonuclease HII [Oscillospiraceae bacterium]
MQQSLLEFETLFREKGYTAICGVDEAGRGPLAGPVFAAAVILPHGCEIERLNDSKKLSAKVRDRLFDEICEIALSYSIASASVEEIDSLNILHASMLAMKRAIESLQIKPDLALIDGNRSPECETETLAIVKGDARSASIAAASILAKVSRDRVMDELAQKYPEYAFEKHKGYPTKLHYEKIAEHGILPIHRKSFRLTAR